MITRVITRYPFSHMALSDGNSETFLDSACYELISKCFSKDMEAERSLFKCVTRFITIVSAMEWTFNEYFLFFEEAIFGIKKDTLQRLSESGKILNDSSTGQKMQKEIHKRARKFINKFASKIFQLFQQFKRCGDNIGEQCFLIRAIWYSTNLSDEEVEETRSVLHKCNAAVSEEDTLLVLLTAEGFNSLREAFFRLITTSSQLREMFTAGPDGPQSCLPIIESFFRENISANFTFTDQTSIRMLRVLSQYYESPFHLSEGYNF